MVPTVPEVSTIPLPQTDSIAPRPLLRCIGPSQHLGDLSGLCGTIWTYAAAVQGGKGRQISHVPVLSPQYLQLRIGGQLLWHFMGNNSDLSTEDDRNMPMPGIDVPGEEAYWVPLSVNGVATHAYSPVEGMVSR